MTENQQHQSIYNINQQKQPEKREKPQLLKKPIPKPRRRITIGSGDSNKLNNEENIKLINKSFLNLNIKEEEKNIFKNNFNEKEQQNNNILINSLTTSKRIKTFGGNINNSPPYAPQLPRKILKSGSTPILQPKNQQKIFNQNLNEKHLKINNKLIEEFNKNKNKEKQINLQKQQFGELKRLKIPPPLKNQQQILNNKIIEKRSKTPIRRENEGKKVTSSSSPLFLHCPRASPEATGSSLNSPTSPPPLSTNFVNNWQNVEEGEQNEDLLLKELAAEGDPECLLIASWLESSTCANNGGGEQLDGINDGLDINENQRPRFSLDRLVPPELQLEIAKPIENNEQQICGEFSLQKSSPRGQCQGTVFIHFHQEKNNFDIKIEKEEEQKRIINLNKKKRPLSINNNNNFIKVDGTVEQRKQQNEVPYHHKQIEKEKEENKSKLINQNNNKISPYSTSPSLRSGVTLLEQLVKSHPIWFLPHLDRQAASHLLRHQEPGVFIVRGSSRIINNNSFTNSEVSASFHSSNQRSSVSVMALSVRLPPPKEEENEEIYEEKIDTDQLDHFLLEAVGSGQSVRLQGSPRTFTSLPLLLEHYCQPEAIQELKCSLCLPNSVAKCESIHSLQGLALLGQDFWTSPLAFQNNSTQIQLPSSTNDYSSSSCTRSQCHSPASSSLRSGPLPTLPPIQQQPPKMGTFITQQTHHQNSNHHFFYCESPCPSTTSTAVSAPPTSLIGGEPSSFYGYHHHQRANNNCCCCCCAANGCPGHQQQIMIQQQRQFAALPLRKSRSVQSSFISGTPPQPHYSSHKSTAASFCLSPSTQSLRESNYGQRFMVPPPLKKRGPESFLRALFSPSPQRRRQKGNESSWEWMPSSSPLWEEEQPTNTTNSGNKAIINNAQQQTLKPTTNTHLKQQQRQQPGSSIFARLKGNFRRTSSSGISSPSSKDDWQGRNQVSSELLNARQAAFRRTNTDLGVPTNSGTNRMALALNKMRKQQKPPNPSLPPQSFPQLARVLPQPRTTANLSGAKHSYIINGSSNFNNNNKNNNNNFFITPFAVPPSDIRKQQQNNLIKQTKVYLPTPPLRQRQNNLNNFIEKKNFDGGGFNNNNLNNSSSNKFSTKSQAVIATVHPQPKMVLNSCKKLQTNLDTKEIDDEEENNKLNNSSEYTHLNELFKGEPSTSGEENIVNFRDSFKNGGDEVSVAGTDFNEPWDSNAWENLLEIAKFGDAKTEVPLLSERPRRRRSSCDTSSISSNGSTWRRSSSDDNDEYLNKNKTTKENVKNEKIKQKEKCSDEEKENNTDDDINVAEEAVAMAVVLAGNGTLPNRKKPRPMEWLCEELLENENEEEEEENKINIISNESNQILPQNASLDTLILIEQAAKAANSSRCNMSQRVRWTRNSREASTSLMDIPSSSCAQIEQQNIPQKDDKFDSMEEFNGESGGHRRSERRLRAMMERSIGEHQTQNIHQTAFPSVNAYSTSMDELGSQHSRTGSICPSITPVLSPSRLRNASQESQGEKDPALVIQQYVETLSTDDSTVFGATLQRFVECTLLSREQDPYVVVRRVRQFLNGIKNYLVKNGEADLHLVIERESDRLHADEFLNIDAILESVLNKILLVRIKAQLYRLMIMENTRNGELGKLTENLSLVRAMNAEELGFPEDTVLPDKIRMESINKQLRKMQNHYSPLKKLQLLLRALALAVPHLPLLSSSELQRQQQQQSFVATQPSNSSVFLSPIAQTSNSIGAIGGRLRTNSGSSSGGAMAAALKHPPADELIRWLVYLLARSSTINCEIEAWYMWELLPQQVLSTGDASYFLSILFSAVHVIKHPEIVKRLKNISLMPGRHPLPNIADFLGSQSTLQDVDDFANNNSDLLLRVAIPNEQEGSIEYHTFPVLPKMNASKLCRVIAHQFSVSNPEDYGLYVLFDGYETVLSPDEFPHLVRDNMIQSGKGHLFAYKRSETRIAWPKQAFSNFGTTTTIHTEKKILVEPPKSVNVQQQSSSSSSRLTTSSNGKGRIKAVASNSNNRLTNKNNMLFNIGMHA